MLAVIAYVLPLLIAGPPTATVSAYAHARTTTAATGGFAVGVQLDAASVTDPSSSSVDPEAGESEQPPDRAIDFRESALDEALHHLATAQTFANEQPALGASYLERALERLGEHGELIARDTNAREQRLIALLVLARAQLLLEQRGKAEQTMDEAIRCAGADPLPFSAFGPSLVELHDARIARFQAKGVSELRVECHRACRIFLNERHVGEIVEGDEGAARVDLWPGTYRLLIVDSLDVDPPQRHAVEGLGKRAEPLTIRYENTTEPPPPNSGSPEVTKLQRELRQINGRLAIAKVQPLVPAWTNVMIASLGTAAAGVGGVLWRLAKECAEPTPEGRCRKNFNTKTPGIALVSAGSAMVVTATALLIADAVRRSKARRRLTSKKVARRWQGLARGRF